MRLLLHACCGPCLLEPLDALARGWDVTVAYANPNIHPLVEYERRRDTLLAHAAARDVRVVETPYDPRSWVAAAGPAATQAHERCRACFALRLGGVARHAAEEGFDAFATTLTVSPFQDVEALRDAAEEASAVTGIRYLATDFRDAYPASVRRSRDLGMYRQNYCGCLLSQVEAERDRERRRLERAASRGEPAG